MIAEAIPAEPVSAEPVPADVGPSVRVIHRAYKTEMAPTPDQAAALGRHVGAARYIYNWALARRIAAYEATGKTLSFPELSRELTVLKNTEECAWLYEVSNAALQNAVRHLDTAYKAFFRRVKAGTEAPGFPRFRRRGEHTSYSVNRGVRATESAVKLPRIDEPIRLKERGYLPACQTGVRREDGLYATSATISERAGRWYVSLQVEETVPVMTAEGPLLAAHLGVRQLVTVGDGETTTVVPNPRALDRLDRKMRREQRALSRKKPGSANRAKQREKLARIHARIVNIRQDAAHRATTAIVRNAGALVIEGWDIREMMGDPHLARSIADAAMGEVRRQLRYKCDWRGVALHEIDAGFPSSKRCAQCGNVDATFTTQRVYRCGECGWEADREINATLNLLAAVREGHGME